MIYNIYYSYKEALRSCSDTLYNSDKVADLVYFKTRNYRSKLNSKHYKPDISELFLISSFGLIFNNIEKKSINIIDSKQIISTIELIKILITTIKSLNKYKNIIKYLDYFKTKLEKGIYVNSSIQNGGVNTDDDDICPICFDSLHNGSRLATCAGHGCKFHSDCIKDWFTNSVQTDNYQCPQCRN